VIESYRPIGETVAEIGINALDVLTEFEDAA
jgi:hypothetical protein